MKRKDTPAAYYPVSLNIGGRRCVVVGGGQVALRKVKMLLEHGADVKVISPDLCPELAQLAENGEIGFSQHAYKAGDLADDFLVIAATDDVESNRQIATEARNRSILVNVVDDADSSDFIVPSYLRRGSLTIAVSTSGQSPALARKMRTRLEREISDDYGALTRLIGETRAALKQSGVKVSEDRWQQALEIDSLLELLLKGEEAKARAILLNKLKENQ